METAALALYLPVSNDEALEGLSLPAAAFVILGKAAHFVKTYGQVARACDRAVSLFMEPCYWCTAL